MVMVTVSSGYYDFFLNWLHYGKMHLDIRTCLLAMAEDEAAVALLHRELPQSHVIQVKKEGDGQKAQVNGTMAFDYGGTAFGALVSRRPRHIASLLQKGIAVLYSDLDLIWVRNPLPTLLRRIRAPCAMKPCASNQWSVDLLVMDDDRENVGVSCSGRPQMVHQLYLCTCFLLVAPTAGAIALIDQWASRIQV